MVCTHVRLGILPKFVCVYIYINIEGMYKCQARNFGNDPFLFIFPRVCTHVRLVIWLSVICVYVCDVVESMNTCKTPNFGNKHFSL